MVKWFITQQSACQEHFMKNNTFLSVFWVSLMLSNFEEKPI